MTLLLFFGALQLAIAATAFINTAIDTRHDASHRVGAAMLAVSTGSTAVMLALEWWTLT